MTIHFTPSEPRPKSTAERCAQHPNANWEDGFGLAGGGFGPYKICMVCGTLFGKVVVEDDDGE